MVEGDWQTAVRSVESEDWEMGVCLFAARFQRWRWILLAGGSTSGAQKTAYTISERAAALWRGAHLKTSILRKNCYYYQQASSHLVFDPYSSLRERIRVLEPSWIRSQPFETRLSRADIAAATDAKVRALRLAHLRVRRLISVRARPRNTCWRRMMSASFTSRSCLSQ